MRLSWLLLMIVTGLSNGLIARQIVDVTVDWGGITHEQISESLKISFLKIGNSGYTPWASPLQTILLPVAESGEPTGELTNVLVEELTSEQAKSVSDLNLDNDFKLEVFVRSERGKRRLVCEISPLRRLVDGKVERLVSGSLNIEYQSNKNSTVTGGREFASNSMLASGNWFKIGITEPGVYKVTGSMLKSMGVELPFNSSLLGLYGSGGKMLPFENDEHRPDDLVPRSIHVIDGNDGAFDLTDHFIFYAEGPHQWEFNGVNFEHVNNEFSDTAYFFISNTAGGVRVQERASLTEYDATITEFDHVDFIESDLNNLIKSGRKWYGEVFNTVTSYNIPFSVPGLVMDELISLNVAVAARTIGKDYTSNFELKSNESPIGEITVSGVTGDYAGKYAEDEFRNFEFISSSELIDLEIAFTKGTAGAIGWLDYLELQCRRKLNMSGEFMRFRDVRSLSVDVVQYELNGANEQLRIWDVTDGGAIVSQKFEQTNNTARFAFDQSDGLHEFIAFSGQEFGSPDLVGRVENQNLHGASAVDYVIVTPKLFLSQAKDLAEYREEHDDLSALVVTDEQVFNEFSSGARDLTAIKDFMKMFYDRAGGDQSSMVKYLLLFGDGSYDNKYRIRGNTGLMLTYQSNNSLHAIGSYVSDDYFALLDDNEGHRTSDLVDLGVGRLPVSSVAQANNALDKIKFYESSKTFGSWRNMVGFVGDDEDSKIHMIQTDILTEHLDTAVENLNIDKIYFDAYQQVTSAGGDRYPGVQQAIDDRMNNGALMLHYIGHGGELGWAQERVLEVEQINSYENYSNLPIFMTATCEFSRYDDPARTSAGEYVFLNPRGGGIALFTTTRLVLSSPNFALATVFNKIGFVPMENGKMPRLGDLVRLTKTNSPLTINTRNFTLLGDPAMTLAYPELSVLTVQAPDTVKALGKVTFKGKITDSAGQPIEDFNGFIYPTVYDKETVVNTLNNDGQGIFSYGQQESIIYRGKATVTNGNFEFSFVAPKDISFADGFGKVSYYADNTETDAAGSYENFKIGGTDTTRADDRTGPQVDIFLNDSDFIDGGMTNDNPTVVVDLFDENGINTVGTGIGHDILMTLDGNSSSSIVLNEYYRSETDSYQKGRVRFPLKDLSEGRHTLKVKAWDVNNNSSSTETVFFVQKETDLVVDKVLNYPNPFTTNTGFYFEHNQPYQNLSIRIQVMTVSGKVVRTIDQNVNTDGYRVGPINWDGLDDFGDVIGRGTYLYVLKVTAPTGQTATNFEKLVVF